MTPSRKKYLDEMGLSPQWVLRNTPVAPVKNPIPDQSAVKIEPTPDPVMVRIENPPATPTPAIAHIDDLPTDWPQLEEVIRQCKNCGLCSGRKQAVPGVGDRQAAWLFIGEGPGAEEDAKGEPFVGQAGKLLDAMLFSIDLERGKDVYIANAVKCRPPGNRTPHPDEITQCLPYLEQQIALIAPKIIVLLGRTAVHSVLKEDKSLSSLRGKKWSYHMGEAEIPVIVTYHPAYLLRNLPDKVKVWEDLCFARSLMKQQR